jgi:hypothetical protein
MGFCGEGANFGGICAWRRGLLFCIIAAEINIWLKLTNKLTILVGVLFSITVSSFGQRNTECDTIKKFGITDTLYQNEYSSIKADTILAIWPKYSLLLCWKVQGQYYFKKLERTKKDKIKSTMKMDKELTDHLIKFYENQIFNKTGPIQEKQTFFVEDAPITLLFFKTPNKCWRFSYAYKRSNDVREVWTDELLKIMRK